MILSVEKTLQILRESALEDKGDGRIKIFYNGKWIIVGRIDECEECGTTIGGNKDNLIEKYCKLCIEYGVGSYLYDDGIFIIDSDSDG